MSVRLHNPTSQAHIDELKNRLCPQLALVPHRTYGDGEQEALVELLAGVVRAMDQGSITTLEAMEDFMRHRIPGFSFARWLVDMVDEDVYLDTRLEEVNVRRAA